MKIIIPILLFQFLFHIQIKAQDPLHIKNRNLPCVERKFNLYIHLVSDSLGNINISESDIEKQLEIANQAFKPICISFDYCKIDTVHDHSFFHINDDEEIELLMSRFQKKRRINLYYTGSVLDENINSYSYHSGILTENSGVIIVPLSGKGLIHELGHTFGLLHIFETKFGAEKADGSNCAVSGDLICDTPAAPYVLPNKTCTFTSKLKDINGDFYRSEIGNYMSHFFCAHCFFTTEQYERMVENYLASPIKMW